MGQELVRHQNINVELEVLLIPNLIRISSRASLSSNVLKLNSVGQNVNLNLMLLQYNCSDNVSLKILIFLSFVKILGLG